MAQPHEKVGVQIEAIARQSRLFGGATAANVGVSFDDRDFETCPRQVGREREPVVSSSDDDSIESRHSLLPGSLRSSYHSTATRIHSPGPNFLRMSFFLYRASNWANSLMKGAATSALILQSRKIGPSGFRSFAASLCNSSSVRMVAASKPKLSAI